MKGKIGYLVGVIIVFLLGVLVGELAGGGLGGKKDVLLSNGQSVETKLSDLEKKLDGMLNLGPSALKSDKPFQFNLDKTPVLGKGSAKVKIVLWSDFQCPYCKRMDESLEQLVKSDTGKYALYAKDLVVHPNAMIEHQAALAANAQGKYWEMHDLLFKNQQEMQQLGGDPNAMRAKMEEYAKQVGLNVDKFKTDLDSDAIKAQIEADKKEAQTIPIESTPTAFINGVFNGYDPEEIKAKAVEEASGGKSGSGVESKINSLEGKIDRLGEYMEKMKKAAQGGGENQGPQMGKEYTFNLENTPVMGKPDAKVKLVEFSDFQCPYCERMAAILEDIQKQHPDQVAIYFKDFLIHPPAGLEHEAARSAAAQGKFKEMHDLLFKNRQELTSIGNDEAKMKEKLLALGKEAGLNTGKLKADLDSSKYREQVVASMNEGKGVNVRGTPSVFMNGYFYGYDPSILKAKVDEALKK
jgi:protein-disulfide isomerase